MANANLSIRVDKETKEKVNELFNKFGLTMITAVNMFLKTAIRENRILFELKLEEEPNEVTMKAIEEERRIAKDDNVQHRGFEKGTWCIKRLGSHSKLF